MTNKKVIDEWRKIIEGDKKYELKKCVNCGAEFIPSLTASDKEMCHPCIMANL